MNVQTTVRDATTASANQVAARSFKGRALLIAVVLAAGAGSAIWGWQMLRGAPPPNQLMVSGNIEAHLSLVSFKDVSSRIIELPFDEGQWVERGQLIARVDDSNYRQQVAVDEAAVQVQQQQLASARQNLVAAQNTVANDQADFAQKNADYQRFQQLWNENATSAQSRDQAETAMKQSAAALKRDEAMVGVAEKNIATSVANIKNAEETLRLGDITLGYTVLRAPFSGVIVERQTELGEVMQPGTPVVTLADLDHVWLRAYVSETDLGRIRWGQAATVTTDTFPGKKYPGRISFISSNAEFTPKSVETHQERVTLVYRIKIDIENSNHELKPGMPADAIIELGRPNAERVSDGQPIIRH
jgi:HlyD family secretion protein